jgi:hypothetical protein
MTPARRKPTLTGAKRMPEHVLTLTLPDRMNDLDRAAVIEAHEGLMEFVHGGDLKNLRVARAALMCLLVMHSVFDASEHTAMDGWDEPVVL